MTRPMLKRLQPYIAWLLAIAILLFLFRQSPPKEVWTVLLRANLGLFAVLAVAYFGISYLLDSFTMSRILTYKQISIPLKRFLVFRGHSYYYSVLNYNAGQGLLAYYIKQSESTSWLTVGALVFYVMLNDFLILLLAASVSLWLSPPALRLFASIHHVLNFVIVVLLAVFVLFKYFPLLLKTLREKARTPSWYGFMVQLPLRHVLFIFLYRALLVSFVLGGLYFPFMAFHIDVSFLYYLISAPLVLIVGALPITPAGLGTTQSAFIYLFKDHIASPLVTSEISAEALLLALVLSWTFANLILKCMIGFYFHARQHRISMTQ